MALVYLPVSEFLLLWHCCTFRGPLLHFYFIEYILDISPYISDMRVLNNIYNEFIVYKKIIFTDQELELLDEPMMAMVVFKNLYPKDFADIQMEKGIIKQAFADKQEYLKPKQEKIQNDIDKSTKLLDKIQSEKLESVKELKSAFLCEITGWKGIAYNITPNGFNSTYASEFMQSDFDSSQWSGSSSCSGYYRTWNNNNSKSFTSAEFSDICKSYLNREKRIKLIEENHIAYEQKRVEKLKQDLRDVSGWSLKRIFEESICEKEEEE